MKGIAILLSFLALPFLFASCGAKSGAGEKGKRKWIIGFSQCNNAEPWRAAMNKALLMEAAKHKDEIQVILMDAQNDSAKQRSDVENLVTRGIDLLIISPKESTPLTRPVKKVYESGTPVIVLDRDIDEPAYTCFIGAPNEPIGEMAGKYAVKLLGGKGNVVEIMGLQSTPPGRERHEGFLKGIAGSGLKIIYSQDAAWLREEGMKVMENALQAFPRIDLVYAHNDPMALGARRAAEDAGRAKEMKFIGIDGLPDEGVKAVLEGKLDATFWYPTCGKEAIQYALKILHGEKVPKRVNLKSMRITKENARAFLEMVGAPVPEGTSGKK